LRWPSLLLALLGAMVAMAVGVRWATERASPHAAVACMALVSSLWPTGFGTAVFVRTRHLARRGGEVPPLALLAWLVGFGLGALALSAGSVVALGTVCAG
jgi:hypothetical protein